jgi:hypothetical protein
MDDVTGEPLTQRPDDTPVSPQMSPHYDVHGQLIIASSLHLDLPQEVFNKRLSAFYKSTSPLLTYFQDYHGPEYHEIAGSTSDEVRFARSFNYNAPDGDSDDRAASSSSHATDRPSQRHDNDNLDNNNESSSSPSRPRMTDDSADACPVVPETSANASSTNVEKIWPHLEALVDEYQRSLRRDEAGRKASSPEEVDEVRREADDLRDPDEPVHIKRAGVESGKA